MTIRLPRRLFTVHCTASLSFLLVLLATLPSCRSSARAKEHVENGNRDAKQKQFSQAESEYQQAIQIDPDLAEAHYRLGLLELQLEHPTAATRSLTRAVELDGKNLDARLHLGNLLVSATQYGDARQQAEAVLSIDGMNAGAHRLLGQIALQQTQYAAAENELKQAIDLAPRDSQAYSDLGLAQLLDAEYGAAEKSFQAAVDIRPDDPQTYINLSDFYKAASSDNQGADHAEQTLHQGITRNPNAVELPIALASLYIERGRPEDAKQLLNQIEANQSAYPDGHRAVADFYLSNGDAAAALDRFRALAEKDPRDESTAKKVAECYLQLSKWQEANDWIDQHNHNNDPYSSASVDFRLLHARSYLGAFRLNDAESELKGLPQGSPDAPAVYYYLAQVYVQQEEPAAAQQAFSDALRAQPGYLPAILGLGNISLQQGNADTALNLASQIIATSFWLADAHILAGSAKLLRGDLDQAQRAFEIAIGLNPRSPAAQERLGKVLSLRGNYAEAEKAYAASLALAPDYAPALNGLAEILIKQGKTKQASALIDRQVAAQPKAYQLLVAKAEFCIAQKDWPCAEHSYKQVLALNPYYVNGYLALAHIYAATNHPDEMIQQYEAARSKFPSYLPTYILLGQVYSYVGDVAHAQQTYQDALKVDPNFYQAQMNLARLYADHGGSLADALQLAQKAKASQPDDPNVNDTLGWVYYKQGFFSSAVPALEAAVTKNPQNAAFQFHLGMTYLATGQASQAHSTLQTALNLGLNPQDTRAAQDALQKSGS
jgi:tetratricopeptide (TPR) repeat protein